MLQRVYRAFDARFEKIRAGYAVILSEVLARRRLFAGVFLAFACCPALWCSSLAAISFPVSTAPNSPAHASADGFAHRRNGAGGR